MPNESDVISLKQKEAFDAYNTEGSALDDMPLKGALDNGELEDDAYVENKAVGKYKIVRNIGSGSSSKVVLAYDTNTEERVAIKIVKRKEDAAAGDETDRRIYREVVISTLLNHPNIVRLLDFFYTSTYFFLVFEYVKGVQLYDAVLRNGYIEETEARRYFRQIVSAIDYIHRNCIVHRDLKIENILIDQNGNIKIIDFGLSNFYDNKILLNTCCGSLYFAAPELLLGQRYHGPEVDVWSLGVVLYVMLCGRVPFDDESIYVLQGKIKSAQFEFCRQISADARDLIMGMLLAGGNRHSLEKIKKSAWLNVGFECIVHNYMVNRQPITRLNSECLRALSAALSFQFDNVEEELANFANLCGDQLGSLEGIYWTHRPIVSLYYLLIEDYCVNSGRRIDQFDRIFDDKAAKRKKTSDEDSNGEESPENSEELSSVLNNTNRIPVILHNFVHFVFSREHRELYKRYFIKSIFKHSPVVSARREPTIVWPVIRKSYLKGFFKGIKVRHIGSHNALKKTILDIFLRHDIIYEANEKSYFCSFFDNNDECYFKVSMYYNVILSEYYLVLTLLNSRKHCFKTIYGIVQNALKERAKPTARHIPHKECC